MNVVKASSPGRVCFAGESMDWISGPSVLCAVNLLVNVTISCLSGQNQRLEIRASGSMNESLLLPINNIGQYSGHALDYINAAMKVLTNLGIKPRPIKIDITSNLPAKAGVSSSAAVSVATIKALSGYFELTINNHQVAHLAYLVEKEELKTGAGQMDQYACSLGGLIYLDSSTTPPSRIRSYVLPRNIKFIIVDTITPKSTAESIRTKKRRYAQKETGIMAYAEKAEKIIVEIKGLLKQARLNIHRLGELMTACHVTLRDDLRVSTPLLETCVSTCMENKALGAKITGTGMGGCMFALVTDSYCEQVQSALSNLPVHIHVTSPSTNGAIFL